MQKLRFRLTLLLACIGVESGSARADLLNQPAAKVDAGIVSFSADVNQFATSGSSGQELPSGAITTVGMWNDSGGSSSFDISGGSVPEPTSLVIIGFASGIILMRRRRSANRAAA